MRQGLLSEPQASSGPAAITPSPGALVVSPDGVPARSDATFLWRPSTTSTSQNPKNIPACIHPRTDATFLWRPSPSTPQNRKNTPACIHSPDRCHLPLASLSIPTKKRHPAVPTLPDTGTKTPVKQTYTIYNQHSLSAQLNYHQKVLSATQDRWPAL